MPSTERLPRPAGLRDPDPTWNTQPPGVAPSHLSTQHHLLREACPCERALTPTTCTLLVIFYFMVTLSCVLQSI